MLDTRDKEGFSESTKEAVGGGTADMQKMLLYGENVGENRQTAMFDTFFFCSFPDILRASREMGQMICAALVSMGIYGAVKFPPQMC